MPTEIPLTLVITASASVTDVDGNPVDNNTDTTEEQS